MGGTYSTLGGNKNCINNFSWRALKEGTLQRPRRGWECHIKVDFVAGHNGTSRMLDSCDEGDQYSGSLTRNLVFELTLNDVSVQLTLCPTLLLKRVSGVSVFKKKDVHNSCLFMEVRYIYNNLVWLVSVHLGCLRTEGRRVCSTV
jgi:hypothetical protein